MKITGKKYFSVKKAFFFSAQSRKGLSPRSKREQAAQGTKAAPKVTKIPLTKPPPLKNRPQKKLTNQPRSNESRTSNEDFNFPSDPSLSSEDDEPGLGRLGSLLSSHFKKPSVKEHIKSLAKKPKPAVSPVSPFPKSQAGMVYSTFFLLSFLRVAH